MNESLMPSREKYWEEKDDKQKIAKLSDIIISLAQVLVRHEDLLEDLMRHSHGESGVIVAPIQKEKKDWTPYWMKNPLGKEK